jgi:hypothetical protein
LEVEAGGRYTIDTQGNVVIARRSIRVDGRLFKKAEVESVARSSID